MATKPKLLIIGGGFAGVTLATQAISFAEVTLVDPKEYFELTWATIKGIYDKEISGRSCIAYTSIPDLTDVKMVKGLVTNLTSKEAKLSDGSMISFDYLAIASGSAHSEAFKSYGTRTREERLKEIEAVVARVHDANSIAVVGGGPAGVEAAAEVAEAFPGKVITLVHPGKQLLPALPPKAGALAERWLEAHKVKVLLETSVMSRKPKGPAGPATLALSDSATGESSPLSADLVLWCAGPKPNTAFLAGGELAAVLDYKGHIKVQDTLQVEGHPHMFAMGDCLGMGDCNNVLEAKAGFVAAKHAELAATSLQALIKAVGSGGPAPKLGKWLPSMGNQAVIVTLGRREGVYQMGGNVYGSCLPTNMKGLFVEQYRKQFKVVG